MHEIFKEDLEALGAPSDLVPASSEQIERLSTILPVSLVEFFEQYGFGQYYKRRVQYCDPEEFRGILAMIFAGDKDFSHKDCHVVAYTAFGELWAWSERHDHFTIDLIDLEIQSDKLAPPELHIPASFDFPNRKRSTDPDILARCLLPSDEEDSIDSYDFMRNPLFKRCVKMHGPLERGECYGFFPAIAMLPANTRDRKVENIKRVSALEHITFLAQLGTFNLVKFSHGKHVPVRPIG